MSLYVGDGLVCIPAYQTVTYINIYEKRILRQVGHLQELYRDARSTKHKILTFLLVLWNCASFVWHTAVFGVPRVRSRRSVCDFSFSPPSEWDLRSSDMLYGVGWYLPTFRDNLTVPSRQGSNITANLCSVTCQKSEYVEVTSLIIIVGAPVVECLGWGVGGPTGCKRHWRGC